MFTKNYDKKHALADYLKLMGLVQFGTQRMSEMQVQQCIDEVSGRLARLSTHELIGVMIDYDRGGLRPSKHIAETPLIDPTASEQRGRFPESISLRR